LSIPCDELALCTVRAARGTGTGFAFLKPGWVVTAKHVVSGQPPTQPIQLVFREGPALSARVFLEHPRVDLAVLEVEGGTRCRAPFMPGDAAPPSGGLFCVGEGSSVAAVDAYERTTRQRDGFEEVLFIFRAPHGQPGRSGSPLLAPDGSVVGVVVDGITLGGEHVMRATAITAVLDLALREGL
jgi:S1-C subfamily serine protease